jgi:hypothetical protein
MPAGDTQILSPAGIAEMHRPAAEVKVTGVSLGQYGMGWFIEDRGQTRILWHDGVVPDFFAYMAIVPGHHQGIVLLLNADHLLLSNISPLGVGKGAARLRAGARPGPNRGGVIILWALHGVLLVPALQILGVVLTLQRLLGWQCQPSSRPTCRRTWMLHLLLPLIPNLVLAAIPIGMFASGLAGALFAYAPDLSWLVVICGSSAGVWIFLRSGLILWSLRKGESSQALIHLTDAAA